MTHCNSFLEEKKKIQIIVSRVETLNNLYSPKSYYIVSKLEFKTFAMNMIDHEGIIWVNVKMMTTWAVELTCH